MENEAGRRRMKMIASHFAPTYEDISSAAHLLIPMKCSGSLNSRMPRCDNRLYFARQGSASQAFFMRQHSTHHQQQGERASNCPPTEEPPLFSRARKMEANLPQFQSKECSLGETELPKFARPTTAHPNGKEWSPRMDVAESGRSYILTVEIPGVNANDIRVELNQSNLRIMGKRSNEWWRGCRSTSTSEAKCAYHKREIAQGPYQVSWPLPSDANTHSVSAEFLDGILQIIVPKL